MDLNVLKRNISNLALEERDENFLLRVLGTGTKVYEDRLDQIGFKNKNLVLDAGCGFGQWSCALSKMNMNIEAIDISEKRITVAKALFGDISNLHFEVSDLTNMPFKTESFDAIFCYSAIYYCDPKKVLSEFNRVLKPSGELYICSNSWGWYIHNIIKRPNSSKDFNPMLYGIQSIINSFTYVATGKKIFDNGSVVTSEGWLTRALLSAGFGHVVCGAEGTLCAVASKEWHNNSFFSDKYYGLEGCLEWLSKKNYKL